MSETTNCHDNHDDDNNDELAAAHGPEGGRRHHAPCWLTRLLSFVFGKRIATATAKATNSIRVFSDSAKERSRRQQQGGQRTATTTTRKTAKLILQVLVASGGIVSLYSLYLGSTLVSFTEDNNTTNSWLPQSSSSSRTTIATASSLPVSSLENPMATQRRGMDHKKTKNETKTKHGASFSVSSFDKTTDQGQQIQQRCAILLFGLPRAFESLVLPSLRLNVLPFHTECDYFGHSFATSVEPAGRSGQGGRIDVVGAQELLRNAILAFNPDTTVVTQMESEQEFEQRRANVLAKIAQGRRGGYQPREFDLNTTRNIAKMWHSIQAAWELMEQHENTINLTYHRVGAFRSDVVYATPVDIWEIANNQRDVHNTWAVLPAFAAWPVNDRMLYGPRNAVREWAARRFQALPQHVQWTRSKAAKKYRGFGMHSEVFVAHRVLPQIRQLGYQVWEHDALCFWRARPDETIWLNDCDAGKDNWVVEKSVLGKDDDSRDCLSVVETVLNRTCVPATYGWIEKTKTVTLQCRLHPEQVEEPRKEMEANASTKSRQMELGKSFRNGRIGNGSKRNHH